MKLLFISTVIIITHDIFINLYVYLQVIMRIHTMLRNVTIQIHMFYITVVDNEININSKLRRLLKLLE